MGDDGVFLPPIRWDGEFSIDIENDGLNLRQVLDELEGHVQRQGWALVGTAIMTDHKDYAPFTYTVGLQKRQLPDVVTFGLCGCSDEVVETIAHRQLKAGAFDDGQITQIGGSTVRVSRWPYSTGQMTLLNEYYRYRSAALSLLLVTSV